jgi:hypothetical protein
MQGWIKLHRQIVEWEWYTDANTFRVFMHLLLNANHKEKRYKGILIKKGQLLTGRKSLALALDLSERQVRTALTKLKKSGEIDQEKARKTTKSGSIITICNYASYQSEKTKSDQHNDQHNDQEATSKRPANDQQATTNKNVKNNKNNKNEKNERENLSTQDFNKNLKKNNLTKKITAESVSDELKQFYKTENGFNNWKEIIDVLQFKIPNKSIRNKKIKEMLSAMSRQYVLNDRWNESESIQIKHTRFLDWIARERTLN